jgi:gamma-glutamyltranspeptidase
MMNTFQYENETSNLKTDVSWESDETTFFISTITFKDGKPWLAFAVQGGDSQDQNLLQFFLNVAEFGMTPQEATEAANFESFQMRSSFDKLFLQSVKQARQLALSNMPLRLKSSASSSSPRSSFRSCNTKADSLVDALRRFRGRVSHSSLGNA